MKVFKLLFTAAFLLVLISSCNKYNKVTKSKDYEYKLKMADEFYGKGKYKIAQELYEELFPVFKGTIKFEELYYKDAYCFYHMKQYADAENLFKGFLEVFRTVPRLRKLIICVHFVFINNHPNWNWNR